MDLKNLFLLPAPINFKNQLRAEDINNLCEQLKNLFKVIILDLNLNFNEISKISSIVNSLIFVSTTNSIDIRNSSLAANLLKNESDDVFKFKLLINKLNKSHVSKNLVRNLDETIDETGLQLIGVLPQSKELEKIPLLGLNMKENCFENKIFFSIFLRLFGKNSKLLI